MNSHYQERKSKRPIEPRRRLICDHVQSLSNFTLLESGKLGRDRSMKNQTSKNKSDGKFTFVLMGLGVILLVVNVLLVQKNRVLKVMANRPDRALEVKPGTALPPLVGVDVRGGKQRLVYGEDPRKTVLLVFSPRCNSCRENLPNWETIIKGVDKEAFRLAAISLQSDGMNDYTKMLEEDRVPVLTEISPKAKVAYNLALTPQMILIDQNGNAEKVWTGLLDKESKQDIERTLKLRFPIDFSAML
jgi:hypothetical protein